MPYNDKEIKRDLESKPAPQHFNSAIDDYEVTDGRNGASFVELLKASGDPLELENLLESLKPQSAYNSSTGSALTVTLDTGLYGGRTNLEVWVKSSAAATFAVQCSRYGTNWRTSYEIELSEAGEYICPFKNAYRYIRVVTSDVNDNEIEIVSSR